MGAFKSQRVGLLRWRCPHKGWQRRAGEVNGADARVRGQIDLETPRTLHLRDQVGVGNARLTARADVPDLVILDVRLPDGLGMEIFGALKQLSPHLQVAVLTLHGDDGYCQRCLALGADWFLVKAEDIDELLVIVQRQVCLNA